MIGKIVTGKSFKGAVGYVMNKPGARLLSCDGVNAADARSVTRSFNFQRKARPEKAEVVGHVSLSFHADDAPRLTDDLMRQLAGEYMQRMNITDTQYIVVRHNDTEHPHIHIIYNRVKYDAKLVRKHNERIRNVAVCKAIKQKYGLTFSEGKQNVKVERLHGPDQVKYAIYGAIKDVLPRIQSVEALAEELKRQSIATMFIHRGGDPEKEVQGLTFTKDGVTFKASQVDRKFSYANLTKTIERNNAEAQSKRKAEEQRTSEQLKEQVPALTESDDEFVKYLCGLEYDLSKLNPEDAARIADTGRDRSQRAEAAAERRRQEKHETIEKKWEEFIKDSLFDYSAGPNKREERPVQKPESVYPASPAQQPTPEVQDTRITEIEGVKLTPQQQDKLYSTQGVTFTYRKNGYERTVCFRPLTREDGPDILTCETLSEKKISDNPVIFGVQLTDEHVRKIRDGQYVYIENLKRNDGTVSPGYLVMDDRLKHGWAFKQRPDAWVKYGKYEMREMDKTLIEAGYVTRALVKWYGIGQTARPFLWKDKTTDAGYKESWCDPRNPKQDVKPTVKQVPTTQSLQEQQIDRDDETPRRRKGRRI